MRIRPHAFLNAPPRGPLPFPATPPVPFSLCLSPPSMLRASPAFPARLSRAGRGGKVSSSRRGEDAWKAMWQRGNLPPPRRRGKFPSKAPSLALDSPGRPSKNGFLLSTTIATSEGLINQKQRGTIVVPSKTLSKYGLFFHGGVGRELSGLFEREILFKKPSQNHQRAYRPWATFSQSRSRYPLAIPSFRNSLPALVNKSLLSTQ